MNNGPTYDSYEAMLAENPHLRPRPSRVKTIAFCITWTLVVLLMVLGFRFKQAS